MNIEIKKLGKGDISQFKQTIRVFEEVFEMKDFIMPGEDYLQQVLDNESFFVFAAFIDGNVVGGLTSYSLQQYYSRSPLVYIFDLAVKKEFQRQGIGGSLIFGLKSYCQEMGIEEVFVQVDKEDEHAIQFYRRTGALSKKVIHFSYPITTQ